MIHCLESKFAKDYFGEHFFHATAAQDIVLPWDRCAEVYPLGYWPIKHETRFEPKGLSTSSRPTYVNHGRWVVMCAECNEGQLAAKKDHRFFCCNCLNKAADHKWISVTWPRNIARIEELLLARPNAENQNWLPGETVNQLLQENKAHGL